MAIGRHTVPVAPQRAQGEPALSGIVRVRARRPAGTPHDVCDITSRCFLQRTSGVRGHTVVSKWWSAAPKRLSVGRTSGRIVTEPHAAARRSSVSRSSGTGPATRASRAPYVLRATVTRVVRESNPSPALWDSAQCP